MVRGSWFVVRLAHHDIAHYDNGAHHDKPFVTLMLRPAQHDIAHRRVHHDTIFYRVQIVNRFDLIIETEKRVKGKKR